MNIVSHIHVHSCTDQSDNVLLGPVPSTPHCMENMFLGDCKQTDWWHSISLMEEKQGPANRKKLGLIGEMSQRVWRPFYRQTTRSLAKDVLATNQPGRLEWHNCHMASVYCNNTRLLPFHLFSHLNQVKAWDFQWMFQSLVGLANNGVGIVNFLNCLNQKKSLGSAPWVEVHIFPDSHLFTQTVWRREISPVSIEFID